MNAQPGDVDPLNKKRNRVGANELKNIQPDDTVANPNKGHKVIQKKKEELNKYSDQNANTLDHMQ